MISNNHKNNKSQFIPDAARTLVQVKDLVHVYPTGTRALENINVSVGEHEKLAIIGQNGSGKTTLVKHFNGLLQPTEGTILVHGADTRKTRTAVLAKTVGYVFQNPNHQLFCVTVAEELRFGLRNLRLPPDEIEQKVKETIELFKLQPYLDVHPYSLSMGARKLVAIASIFAMGPQLMILDEPTTGQDYESKKILSQVIGMMYESGKSIVFVSHDMSFVAEHADRAIVMSRAHIVFDGSLPDLFIRQDVLNEADLRPPHITQLSQRLSDYGVSPRVLNVAEMVSEVRRCLA
ncbi:MAG: energy-coupling factor ABC transporter ATP-binding protein [Chloroflexi bacterium]|nr:energy-coupling factor ABC transporter ATP-binding protein [Chloroflexota bacterium]